MIKKTIAMLLVVCTLSISVASAKSDTVQPNLENVKEDIVVLGNDLRPKEQEALLEWFDAPEETPQLRVTNDIIIKQLGLDPNDPRNHQGGCYSSAYVRITEPGLTDNETSTSGLNVKAQNLTEVTDTMLMNALITSGIYHAIVKVSAPFPVTGTSALAGILEGAETVRKEEISLKQKETAQKEIETTMDLAEDIGAEEASIIINEIKTVIIQKAPKNTKKVEKIVKDVLDDYTVEVKNESVDKINELMTDINEIDINYEDVQTTLEDNGSKLKDKLEEMGRELKESGIFQKMWTKVKNFFGGIWDSIKNVFTSDEVETENNNEEVAPPVEERPEGENTEASPEIEENSNENDEVVKPEDESNSEASENEETNTGTTEENKENLDENEEAVNPEDESNNEASQNEETNSGVTEENKENLNENEEAVKPEDESNNEASQNEETNSGVTEENKENLNENEEAVKPEDESNNEASQNEETNSEVTEEDKENLNQNNNVEQN